MSDNGTIVLDGLVLSGGGSGGGTADTTSFDPTATIDATNVQDAIEEVDSSLSDITKDIAAISGLGGYINSYDFGTATPTQQALTDYALTQIPNITALEVFNGTRVKNLFDNHIWILTNTPNTIPPVFGWADNGYDTVGIASNTVAGLVKGSATNGGLTIASDGTAAITGFNTKYDKTGGTLTGNVIINRGTGVSAISLLSGGVYQVVEGSSTSLCLYKNDDFINRLASISTAGKVKWYVYKDGVAKELGLTDAREISYSGTLSSTTVKNAIEEVDGKIEELTGIVDETAVSLPVNYRQIASKTCTSMSETSLLDTTGARGTNIIPANTLQVGDVIMIDIEGDISGLSGATATLNIKYGSTVIATLAKPFTDTYAGIHFDVKATATVRAIGATGKLVLSGLVYLRNRAVQGAGIAWPIGGISEVTIDTTAENALDATIAWSAGDAGNTITASQFVISSLLR